MILTDCAVGTDTASHAFGAFESRRARAAEAVDAGDGEGPGQAEVRSVHDMVQANAYSERRLRDTFK